MIGWDAAAPELTAEPCDAAGDGVGLFPLPADELTGAVEGRDALCALAESRCVARATARRLAPAIKATTSARRTNSRARPRLRRDLIGRRPERRVVSSCGGTDIALMVPARALSVHGPIALLEEGLVRPAEVSWRDTTSEVPRLPGWPAEIHSAVVYRLSGGKIVYARIMVQGGILAQTLARGVHFGDPALRARSQGLERAAWRSVCESCLRRLALVCGQRGE